MRLNRLLSRQPGPEVLLVVEVAETSAAYDREVKLPRYAGAGIAEVWLVDLAQEYSVLPASSASCPPSATRVHL